MKKSFIVKALLILVAVLITIFLLTDSASKSAVGPNKEAIKIGSRDFPESVLIAEILSSAIEKHTEYEVDRKFHLGGVKICLAAMDSDNLDIYPDYTGSLIHNVLGEYDTKAYMMNYLREKLASDYGFNLSDKLGFDNSFVLAVRKDFAKANNLENISDLYDYMKASDADALRVALKHSFINRPDGYKQIKEIYGIEFEDLKAMEYNIAFKNLLDKRIDVIDSFSTDSRVKHPELVALRDDRKALLAYDAVYVYRDALSAKYPELKPVLAMLENSLTSKKMLELNARIENGETYKEVASDFLAKALVNNKASDDDSSSEDNDSKNSDSKLLKRLKQDLPILGRALSQHLSMSFLAAFLAAILGVLIGIAATYSEKLAKLVLGIVAVTQTIPSLALLALLIPLVGLGFMPALIALLIYALLPVVQNTYTGIKGIEPEYIELAKSLALKEKDILGKVKLPMAMSFIIAGIKTSLVICIGTATLATFVGGGGLGDLIKAGIDLNSNYLISLGALPAAILALVANLILSKIEKKFAY